MNCPICSKPISFAGHSHNVGKYSVYYVEYDYWGIKTYVYETANAPVKDFILQLNGIVPLTEQRIETMLLLK